MSESTATTSDETDFFVVIPSALIALGPDHLAVYAVLRDMADRRSNECWPSHRTISQRSGVSVRQTKRVLTALQVAGWITWQERTKEDGSQTSNLYHVYGTPRPHRPTPLGHPDLPPRPHRPTELITNEPVTNRTNLRSSEDDQAFDEFWKIYPRKVKKQAARKAWTKAVAKADPSLIITAAKRYADDPNLPIDKQFIAHPPSWLNGERWEDEDDLPPVKPPSGAAMFTRLAESWEAE